MKSSFLFLAAVVLFATAVVSAQAPFRLQQNYFTGLTNPLFLTSARDGTRRIFVVERGGTVKVAQPGSKTFTTYLTRNVSTDGERGLLGLVFHPEFETNRRLFVYYTRTGDGAIEIAEYSQDAGNPNNASFARVIITVPHPTFNNHNGGTVQFGPDGYLYFAPGDGGSGNDPNANSQNINSLLGKMIRIDVNTPPLQSPAYNIPQDNPYVGVAGADEIFAIGLRNPYRFSFDRGGTNQLYVADVGQSALEEVSIVSRGNNLGWRVYEGTNCTGLDPSLCSNGANPINHTEPIFTYGRVPDSSNTATRCSITGGYVYRGTQNALPQGAYVYGDYCTGEIMLWHQNQQSVLRDTGNFNLVGFGEDDDGEVYVVRQNGNIDKIAGVRATADFDGDGGSDFSVFRPSTGFWFSASPRNGTSSIAQLGVSTDIPVAEDYDGDGKTDLAVWRPGEGVWYYIRSSDATVGIIQWGTGNDVPAPGDFDGDRKADLVVYRPSSGIWYMILSGAGFSGFQFGAPEDIPVNADYDGDGKDDIALWRPSGGLWYRVNSRDSSVSVHQLGGPGDTPTSGDFDGDGKVDQAIFRPSDGSWWILRSQDNGISVYNWGTAGDVPVPGDYDLDHRDDVAVFRPNGGTWWILRTSDLGYQVAQFGADGDIPVPSRDRP